MLISAEVEALHLAKMVGKGSLSLESNGIWCSCVNNNEKSFPHYRIITPTLAPDVYITITH
ncbi:unnamed protein product [Rhodiola kirilowii]